MNWYKTYKQIEVFADKRSRNGLLMGIPIATLVLLLVQNHGMTPQQAQHIVETNPQQAQSIVSNSQNQTQMAPQTLSAPKTESPSLQTSGSVVSLEELIPIISLNEGRRARAYNDSHGYRTVGVGFCIDPRVRPDARQKIESLGANFDAVYNQRQDLTNQQIDALLKESINEAIQVAQNYIGNLSFHPKNVQIALIDMAFNLGPTKLNQFVRLKQQVLARNYEMAAREMEDSRWYGQVRDRGPRMTSIMRNTNQP